CHTGHDMAHLAGADTVVVSAAIPAGSPELVAARARGLQVLTRADLLALVSVDHRTVVVTGTHGKTTTAAMLSAALQHWRADPSFALGSVVNEPGATAHHGSGPFFVMEADDQGLTVDPSARPEVVVMAGLDHDPPSIGFPVRQDDVDRWSERPHSGGLLLV